MFLILFIGVLIASSKVGAAPDNSNIERPPQFVLLAFDGSKNADMWRETREFAISEKVKFTYFISGVYYLADRDKAQYTEPLRGPGKSAIGFGKTTEEVSKRVALTLGAYEEGHEIASHANGHYNAETYSYSQWTSELSQFKLIISDASEHLPLSRQRSRWHQLTSDIKGFRAPLLGVNRQTFKSLKEQGYQYDTSLVHHPENWPQFIHGLWSLPLAATKIEGSKINTLTMDYNFYFQQSKAQQAKVEDLRFFEEQVLTTYQKYFLKNYHGNRSPVHIGHHFSMWNNGIYWSALKRFAKNVCSIEEVICGTYSELVKFLNENKHSVGDYEAGNFEYKRFPVNSVISSAFTI